MSAREDLRIEELGIEFVPLWSKDHWLVAASWHDGQNAHVYSVRMGRDGDRGWTAHLENDGREFATLSSPLSAWTAIKMGLSAMKAYIRRGHRRAIRTLNRQAVDDLAAHYERLRILEPACGHDDNLANAVLEVADRRGIDIKRLKGVNFMKMLELFVESVAMSSIPKLETGGEVAQ